MKAKPFLIALAVIAVLVLVIVFIRRQKKKEKSTGGILGKVGQVINNLTDMDGPSEHFRWREFDSADAPGSGKEKMHPDTIAKLVTARMDAKIPFRINSAYRTPKHNKKVGGVTNSAHTRGRALDISLRNLSLEERKTIIRALVNAGFTRIGVYKTFVHADDDPTLPQRAVWGDFPQIQNWSQLQQHLA